MNIEESGAMLQMDTGFNTGIMLRALLKSDMCFGYTGNIDGISCGTFIEPWLWWFGGGLQGKECVPKLGNGISVYVMVAIKYMCTYAMTHIASRGSL